MKIIRYESLPSTNSEAAHLRGELCHGDVVVCRCQTAGRGQRGNSWESEPGKNLTFSIFLRPTHILAADSFLLSMKVSLAVIDTLDSFLAPRKVEIKWPNDIYCGNLKLAGILIENSFSGNRIDSSIIGIGLNVNQKTFVSDAPNPVSMSTIAGRDFDTDEILNAVCEAIIREVDSTDCSTLVERYHEHLWRRNGLHRWQEPGGKPFTASIAGVAPSGHLTLITSEGEKSYAFKEVSPLI